MYITVIKTLLRICFTTFNDRVGSGPVTGEKSRPGSICVLGLYICNSMVTNGLTLVELCVDLCSSDIYRTYRHCFPLLLIAAAAAAAMADDGGLDCMTTSVSAMRLRI